MELLANRTMTTDETVAKLAGDVKQTQERVVGIEKGMMAMDSKMEGVKEAQKSASSADPRYDTLASKVDG